MSLSPLCHQNKMTLSEQTQFFVCLFVFLLFFFYFNQLSSLAFLKTGNKRTISNQSLSIYRVKSFDAPRDLAHFLIRISKLTSHFFTYLSIISFFLAGFVHFKTYTSLFHLSLYYFLFSRWFCAFWKYPPSHKKIRSSLPRNLKVIPSVPRFPRIYPRGST